MHEDGNKKLFQAYDGYRSGFPFVWQGNGNAVDDESKRMAEKAEVRDKQYQDILCNEDGDDSTPSYYSLYGLASVAAGIAAYLRYIILIRCDTNKGMEYKYSK